MPPLPVRAITRRIPTSRPIPGTPRVYTADQYSEERIRQRQLELERDVAARRERAAERKEARRVQRELEERARVREARRAQLLRLQRINDDVNAAASSLSSRLR